MKACCIEFSNILTDEKREILDIMNRELFYKLKEKDGYTKTMDFNEFPLWINHIQGVIHPNEVDVHICRNISDTIKFINNSDYDYILFSNIICTSEYIEEILSNVNGSHINFIVGTGVGSTKLHVDFPNVYQYDNINDFLKIHSFGKSYTLLKTKYNSEFNTRIYTTYGCKNNCIFCKNDGKFGLLDNPHPFYKDLINPYTLIYVGNKTFLQGGMNELNSLPNESNLNIFVVQSCINTLRDNIWLFRDMSERNIHIVEIGVESFSKNTLYRLGKPNDLSALPLVLKGLQNVGINVILNIMVGIKGDTEADYEETIKGIEKYKSLLYALNITYYSDYDSTIKGDNDERILIKSWIKGDMIKATKDFAEKLYRLNYEIMIQN